MPERVRLAAATDPEPPTGRLLDVERLGDHQDRLYRAAWALCGDRHEAEDLVQETYSRVLARPRWLYGHDDLGYLLRALRNTHRTARRRSRPVQVALDGCAELSDRRAHGRAAQALEVQALYGAIAALPRRYREAITAVDVVGLSYRDAAVMLRTREATLTTRLSRARALVAAAVGPREPAETDA